MAMTKAEYRTHPLPPIEAVQAHFRRGGWWHTRLKGRLEVRRLKVIPWTWTDGIKRQTIAQEEKEYPSRRARMTWRTLDEHSMSEKRTWSPCRKDGTPCAWPKAPVTPAD